MAFLKLSPQTRFPLGTEQLQIGDFPVSMLRTQIASEPYRLGLILAALHLFHSPSFTRLRFLYFIIRVDNRLVDQIVHSNISQTAVPIFELAYAPQY